MELTCDVCGADCFDESYLFNDEEDICPRCFRADANGAEVRAERESESDAASVTDCFSGRHTSRLSPHASRLTSLSTRGTCMAHHVHVAV